MATTYDKASLVMIPSGVKEDKLYSIKPTDGSGDFTFSRGTDTATRVNASGLIEKERGNLILQSNTFDTTWYDSGVTETSGNAGYDGTNDAWEITRGGAFNYKAQDVSTSGVQTFSTYAKRSSFDFLLIRFQRTSSSYAGAYFDLTNGVVSSTDGTGVIDSNIESVGSDWYRISITFNESLLRVLYYPVPSDGGVGVGGSGSIFIQDAQLEQGLVATDYIETTSSAVYEGITDNLPRLDYSGGASCPSLLLEPSRTNYLPDGEYIANWAGANTTIVTNATTSPEGLQNAHSVTFASGGYWYKSVSISYTAGQAYSWSIYTTTEDTITRWGASTPAGTDTLSIEDAGNGWYRQTLTRVVSGSGTANFQPLMDAVFVGVGTTFYVYGAQLEAGSYPTSYIPTYGTSASRAEDDCFTASPSTSSFGQTEGTIFTEIKINAITSGSFSRVFNLKNSGGSNQIYIQQNDSRINAVVFNGSNQFSSSTSSGFLSVGSVYKIALAYKNADYALYINGTQIGTGSASGLGTLAVDRVDYATGAGNIVLGNEVKQSLVFNTRLTNAELAALTA